MQTCALVFNNLYDVPVMFYDNANERQRGRDACWNSGMSPSSRADSNLVGDAESYILTPVSIPKIYYTAQARY